MGKMAENHPDLLSDNMVWYQFKSGDDRALDILLSRHFRPLLHYGSKFTKDRFLIEDVIQDLFLEFLEKRERLGDPVSVKNYLLKCLRNNLTRALKNQTHKEEVSDQPDSLIDAENMENFLIGLDESAELSLKMSNYFSLLTTRQKECLFLRYYQDQTNEEIASIMGINKQSVANLLAKSITILKHNWVFEIIFILFNTL